MSTPEELFGIRVRMARQARELTQRELATFMIAAGYPCSQSKVAKLERGQRPTGVGEVAALSRILRVPVERLIARYPDRVPS